MSPAVDPSPFLSIIIPVHRDGPALDAALGDLLGIPDTEIIVANAGPPDGYLTALRSKTAEVVRWLDVPRGRARQMNAGALEAAGRWLLFLHADTRLTPGWLDAIRCADRDPDIVAGCFRFALASPARPARVIEAGVRWRVRWLQLPYGDQGLFVRRIVFDALGGYADLPLMEDVELVRRLRRVGRFFASDVAALTSARKWEHQGWLRRSTSNVCLVILYFAGVAPRRLASLYRHADGRNARS